MLSQGARGYAFRQGDWVYLPQQGSLGFTVPARPGWDPYPVIGNVNSDVDEKGHIKPTAPADQLYNLADDPQQKTNAVRQHLSVPRPCGRGSTNLCHRQRSQSAADEISDPERKSVV